jgi:hypothetical protein
MFRQTGWSINISVQAAIVNSKRRNKGPRQVRRAAVVRAPNSTRPPRHFVPTYDEGWLIAVEAVGAVELSDREWCEYDRMAAAADALNRSDNLRCVDDPAPFVRRQSRSDDRGAA